MFRTFHFLKLTDRCIISGTHSVIQLSLWSVISSFLIFPRNSSLFWFGKRKWELCFQKNGFPTTGTEETYPIPFYSIRNTNDLRLILPGRTQDFISIRQTLFYLIRCTDMPKKIIVDGWNVLIPIIKKRTFL